MNKKELRAKARKETQYKGRLKKYTEMIFSKLHEGLQKDGYSFMHVAGDPALVYTIGLTKLNHPNICTVGGNGHVMAKRLSEICEEVKAGKVYKVGDSFEFGEAPNGKNYVGTFVEIDSDYFIKNVSNLGNHLEKHLRYPPAQYIQLVWPDIDNNPITDEHYQATQQLPTLGD
jgi:hypothetical protein